MADDRVPIALKSFSADQPSGRTGNGMELCTTAIVIQQMSVVMFSHLKLLTWLWDFFDAAKTSPYRRAGLAFTYNLPVSLFTSRESRYARYRNLKDVVASCTGQVA